MAKILIVEDDASIRVMIKMHLSLVGHTVFEAGDALEARQTLNQEAMDLAILDIMLPGEDGFSIGKEMMESGMSVLFLTARTALSDRLKGLTMGAEDYILKPFEPAELLARIENILKRNRKEEKIFKRNNVDYANILFLKFFKFLVNGIFVLLFPIVFTANFLSLSHAFYRGIFN